MPTSIQLDAFDAEARSVTFTAYGQQKTITGLGEFMTKASLIEYLQSVAETTMKPAAALQSLPDMSEFVGEALPSASDVVEEPQGQQEPL